MPTIIGHSIFAIGLFGFRPGENRLLQTLLLSILCSTIPDADVIGFEWGISYGSMLGHRGFSHSIVFAMMLGISISYFFYPEHKNNRIEFLKYSYYFFLCTVSHGFLDAMTSGGKGVGFFIPFSSERFFFPFRPIPVSPLNLSAFYTSYGWEIIWAEVKFIGILSLMLIIANRMWRRQKM